MGKYSVEETSFKTPPEDSYFFDLVWIAEEEGQRGLYYRWYWVLSPIESQKEWEGCRATSQTSLTPTLNNRFGAFLEKLFGEIKVDDLGSTEELCFKNFRIKGFLEHNKRTYDGEEVTFCNVSKLIEGTVEVGKGVGIEGAGNKLRARINEYLASVGKPLLEIKETEQGKNGTSSESAPPVEQAPKKQDIPW